MRLTDEQIEVVSRDLGADPLEEENPAIGTLRELYGDHTFYVAPEGLLILEPIEAPNHPGKPCNFVQVAEWTDDTKKALKPMKPKTSDMVVDLAG